MRTSKELYAAWREKWRPDLTGDQPIPAQAEQIADDLPHDAQHVLLTMAPWDLQASPVVREQLKFFDLLDVDEASVNALGLAVWRCLIRRDSDWAAREADFAKRANAYFAGAYRANAPGHAALRVANFIDPDAILPVRFMRSRYPDPVAVTHQRDFPLMNYLVRRRIATTVKVRGGYWLHLTEFGRSVAAHLDHIAQLRADIFAGAKRSAPDERFSAEYCHGLRLITALLGRALEGSPA